MSAEKLSSIKIEAKENPIAIGLRAVFMVGVVMNKSHKRSARSAPVLISSHKRGGALSALLLSKFVHFS